MNIGEIGALIHGCAVGSTSWMESLKAIGAFTGSGRGQLIGFTTPKVDFNLVSDFESISLTEFDRSVGGDPAYNFRIAAGAGAAPFEIVHETHYEQAKRGLEGDSYLDFCDRAEIPFGCQTVLSLNDAGVIGLAVLRDRQDGLTKARQRGAFAAVAPLVRSAVELQFSIEGQGQQLMLGAFDALDKAVLLLDGQGRVLAQTAAADALFAGNDTLRLRERRLLCGHPRDQSALDRAISAVLAGNCAEITLTIRQPSAMPLVATVHAFRPPESNIGFRPRAIITLRSVAHAGSNGAAWLRMAGLTSAEIEIAFALGQGLPRSVIAEQRGARIGTVRQQIKSIFAKLGINREAELIMLMGEQFGR